MTKRYSTSTVKSDGAIVPWLSAEGRLSYSPENPPESRYFLQYGWLMPRVYADKRHYYFGCPSSLSSREIDLNIQPLVDFWSKARTGAVVSVCVVDGRRQVDGFTSPIACYRYRAGWDNRDTYMLIQHGSYLAVDVAEQPLIKDGLLVLFRGVGKKRSFCWRTWDGPSSPHRSAIFQCYFDVHQQAFSDSEISFQVAHAWVYRCETGFLKWKMSWIDLARERGFDPENGPLERWLTSAYRQSMTLRKSTAACKFGPNYVRCATPMNNVRIMSFVAGESEVHVVDPRRVEIATPRLGKSTFGTWHRESTMEL